MVSTTTIRVSMETHARLQHLAQGEQESIGAVVDRAVEQYEEKLFWQRYHDQLRDAQADPVAWAEWQDEIAVFDGALLDGLEERP